RLLIQSGNQAGSLVRESGATPEERGTADEAGISSDLAAARFCYALKESHVYHIDYPGLLATREVLLGFGRRLLAEGVLAAIVAREYRLPAVVGAAEATSILLDGHSIRVDGDAGTVEPLT